MKKQNILLVAQLVAALKFALPILREIADETVGGKTTIRAVYAIKALDELEKAILAADAPEQPISIEKFTRSIL